LRFAFNLKPKTGKGLIFDHQLFHEGAAGANMFCAPTSCSSPPTPALNFRAAKPEIVKSRRARDCGGFLLSSPKLAKPQAIVYHHWFVSRIKS
jgi:hypothetical protein